MITDLFLWIQIVSTYLGQTINDGFYYGCFDYVIAPDQPALQAIVDTAQTMMTVDGTLKTQVSAFRDLGLEGQLTIKGINIYAKGAAGTVVAQNKAGYNLVGTREGAGSGEPLPPNSVLDVYFPALVYDETGNSWGLPGVYEGDQAGGILSPSGAGVIAANVLAGLHSAGHEIDTGTNQYMFLPAKVSRIKYTTPKGKTAYRLPFSNEDEPVVIKVGTGSVKPEVGNNKHRKIGNGI